MFSCNLLNCYDILILLCAAWRWESDFSNNTELHNTYEKVNIAMFAINKLLCKIFSIISLCYTHE